MTATAKYLRQEPHGFIYMWTPDLALRSDMVECNARGEPLRVMTDAALVNPAVKLPLPDGPALVNKELAAPAPVETAATLPQPASGVNFGAMFEDELHQFISDHGLTVPGTVKKLETLRARVQEAYAALTAQGGNPQ